MDSVFQSIEKTKAQLAAEDKKKIEQEKARKRKELQNNAFIRRMRGGTDDDLTPLTSEEQDLLDGKDLEHLKMVNGVICRINDAGDIIAPESMIPTPENHGNSVKNNVIESHEKTDAPPAVPIQSTEKSRPEEQPKMESTQSEEKQQIPAPASTIETPIQTQPITVLVEPVIAPSHPDDNVEVLSPMLLLNKRTKIYFAANYNKHLQKAAYAAIIKRMDDTEILIGDSFETSIPSDGIYVGIVAALSAFDDMGIDSVIIYATKEITRALRRNSMFVMDEFTPEAGNYLKFIKEMTQSKYIAVSPRESRLDIQKSVQIMADGMTEGFAKDPDYDDQSID